MKKHGMIRTLETGGRPVAATTWRGTRHALYTLFIFPFAFAAALCAATQPALVVFVDQTPIVIDAPAPFVEASRILPAAFAQRSRALSARNRLLAWFIPAQTIKEGWLDGKAPRCRVLQAQVLREMEPERYNTESFKVLRDETLAGCAVPRITDGDAETLFAMLDLRQLSRNDGGRKILGAAELGENSFTLCVATGTEGSDHLDRREIETSIICVTYMLIQGKILLLTVTCPELSAKELRNAMCLPREWLALLRRSAAT
jgi:hypothetical protein